MADVLAMLAELDNEKKPNRRPSNNVKRNNSNMSLNRRTPPQNIRPRPQSVPPPKTEPLQTPPDTPQDSDGYSIRSASQGPDSRRVSFAEAPRPQIRRIRVPTKTDALSSGFLYDTRLHKYGVSEEEWDKFSNSVVEACEVPSPGWAWTFYRKDVIKRVKKELQYEGELKRVLRRANKDFRRRGFQVWLDLPVGKGEKDPEAAADGASKEERQQSRREAKRFRIVISPNSEKGSSVYSRSSSLTRSVTGEGASISDQPSVDQEIMDAEKAEAERAKGDEVTT